MLETPLSLLAQKWSGVHSFDEALGLLNDRYPGWFRLYLKAHPEFLDAVLAEVEKKGSPDDVARWLERWKRMASCQ
jgi:hypothetical protein